MVNQAPPTGCGCDLSRQLEQLLKTQRKMTVVESNAVEVWKNATFTRQIVDDHIGKIDGLKWLAFKIAEDHKWWVTIVASADNVHSVQKPPSGTNVAKMLSKRRVSPIAPNYNSIEKSHSPRPCCSSYEDLAIVSMHKLDKLIRLKMAFHHQHVGKVKAHLGQDEQINTGLKLLAAPTIFEQLMNADATQK